MSAVQLEEDVEGDVKMKDSDNDVIMSTASTVPPSSPSMMSEVSTTSTATRIALKANSTSTVFASSSISDPNLDEVILALAMVLQLQMTQDQNTAVDDDRFERFKVFCEGYEDDSNMSEQKSSSSSASSYSFHVNPSGKVSRRRPTQGDDDQTEIHEDVQKRQRKTRPDPPPLDYVYKFVKAIHHCAQFSTECNTISLIYINRLIAYTGIPLHAGNWRPLLLTALLIAQKVWDDRSLLNSHFSLICPIFNVSHINKLERRFLELIDYDVSVSAKLYAKYYFELRTLCEAESRQFAMSPLSNRDARRLEHRSSIITRRGQSLYEKEKARRKTMDMFACKPPSVILS